MVERRTSGGDPNRTYKVYADGKPFQSQSEIQFQHGF